MASYTTRARVKQALRIPTGVTQQDAYIDDLLPAVDELVNGYVGVASLTQANYDETHDIMPNQTWLALKNLPVTSIAALTDDGTLIAATDYYVEEKTGYVRLKDSGSFFTEGIQKAVITYTGGNASTPSDVIRAATMIAAAMFNAEGHAGFDTEKTASYAYKLDGHPSGIPALARTMLNRRARVFGFGSAGA